MKSIVAICSLVLLATAGAATVVDVSGIGNKKYTVQVSVSHPMFARCLQSEAARLGPAYVRESVPMYRESLESVAQTFLFQLFPRCFLPVRAGPLSAC